MKKTTFTAVGAYLTHLKKGTIVQFKTDWGKPPTPENTAIIQRVAKDKSWVDVKSAYGSKRIPDPMKHLRMVGVYRFPVNGRGQRT